MYITDIVWWSYTAYLVVLVIFMLCFGKKVQQGKGK
jgi:hypothetical protein